MTSDKPIKPMEQIIEPYSFVPPVEIEMQINGTKFWFKRLQRTTLTKEQFDALLTTDYGKYLY